jgi:zeta-carotene desaturase
MAPSQPVIVVGGGIAGIAAALHLSEHNVPVTLLETRTKLGGRATSFTDVRTAETIDNCQHVAMGCCTNYLDLCRRLAVLQHMQWTEHTTWVEAGGRTSVIARCALPAPAHFLPGFLAAKFLDATEKIALAAALGTMLREDRRRYTGITFAQWLAMKDQPPSVISKFWSPVVVSACNLDVEKVCAATAMHVFQDGFLANADAPAIAVSTVPLVRLYDAAVDAIEDGGGEVRLSTGVERVWPDRVLLTSGETIKAQQVILAVPPERARRLSAPEVAARDNRFAQMERITHSPILGVHLIFDRPVLPHPHCVLVERPTQWLFRKDDEGRKVHAVISAADDWMSLDEAEITRRVMADVTACFPAAAAAKVIASRPVKEKLATFAPTIDVEKARPTSQGPSGIILAGDYIQTGWPATMEGATRSGAIAAAAMLGMKESSLVVADMKAGFVSHAIAALA